METLQYSQMRDFTEKMMIYFIKLKDLLSSTSYSNRNIFSIDILINFQGVYIFVNQLKHIVYNIFQLMKN